jgi:hypothetical protein
VAAFVLLTISASGDGGHDLGIVRELDDQIRVEYSQFYLVDTDISDLPEPRLTPAQWVDTGLNWAAFLSGGQDHYATVRMELWNSEPTSTTETWDLTCDAFLTSTSGEIVLWALTIGPSDRRLVLAGAGQYNMRVYCRGRQAVAQALDEVTTPEASLPQAVEQYLLQLWRP